MNKKQRQQLSENLNHVSQLLDAALKAQAEGTVMPYSGITPEEAIRRASANLFMWSQELKSA